MAPETGIVMVQVPDVAKAVEDFGRVGVRALSLGGRLRLITHRDVSRADVLRAVDRVAGIVPSR
ncbi:hypothetical protein ACFWOX_00690 [Streptomyces sp. NPDC058467]|uniref:hypothetical protein n=2 Tax=unclassified Streptomyces TaxID=2593676 RepID=UPI003660BFFE